MFNLEALNDYEFEILCKDVLENKLEVPLYTFAKGRDGGIDICDAKDKPTIVGQAKHYQRSSFNKLLSSLKKEIKKVNVIKPKQYYIFTSQSLTKENKNIIYQLFQEYMKDTSNVIDASEIDDFLSKAENEDIVRKNYKLWLCASDVLTLINNQNVFIDCDELLDDIENSTKFFVETQAYNQALKKLVEERIIIIIGDPGVGKSTLSKMVILKFVAEGYGIRYTTDNEIGNIKNTLSLDPSKKEIVLLDDFLGQHYLKIKESQPNEIKSLITFVKRNDNKKIILNSRITILNEAIQQSITFKELMEKSEIYTYLINLDKMSRLEKAKIIYNHIFFNNLPEEHFAKVRENQNYLTIIHHKNYNPRIIEYVTKRRIYEKVSADDYFQYIMKKLNEPDDVWQDEFRNRISEEDRILMNTIYSLTDTTVSREVLESTFNSRIKKEKCDTSVNVFRNSTIRLTNSLLRNIEEKGDVKIGTINPSVNDFLKTNLKSNSVEQLKIIENAVFIEPMLKVSETQDAKDYVRKILLSKELLSKKVLRNSSFYYYITLIFQYDIYCEKVKDAVQICFERMYQNLDYREEEKYAELLCKIVNGEFRLFYELDEALSDGIKLRYIIEPLKFEHMQELLESLKEHGILLEHIPESILQMLKGIICSKLRIRTVREIDDSLAEIVASKLEGYDDVELAYYKEENFSFLEDIVWDGVNEALADKTEDLLNDLADVIEISTDEVDLSFTRNYFDISEAINSKLSEKVIYDFDWKMESNKTELEIIKQIFER